MQQLMDIRPVAIRAHTVHRIDGGRGLSVTCLQGPVWVTQKNDTRDTILNAGQSFALDRKGAAIVYAFKDAAILVGPAGQVAPAAIPRAA